MAFDRETFLDLLGLVSAAPAQYATEAARLLAREMVADREGQGYDFRGRGFMYAAQAVPEVPLPIDELFAIASNGAGPRLAQLFYSYRSALFPSVSIPFAAPSAVAGGPGNLVQLVSDGAAAGGGSYISARAAWAAMLTSDEAEVENGRLRARFQVQPSTPRFATRHVVQDFAYTSPPYVFVHLAVADTFNFRLYGRTLSTAPIQIIFEDSTIASIDPDPGDFELTLESEALSVGDISVDLGGCPIAVLQIWQD